MTPLTPTAGATDDREIVSTRLIAFPRPLVWQAWTDPAHLARWWGPRGFGNTIREFDLRAGGHWRFVMHGPDGTDYQNHSVFIEVDEPRRIVLDHVSQPYFRLTATFEDDGGKTRLRFCQRFETAAICEQIKRFAVDANEQNFDRLEAVLASMTA